MPINNINPYIISHMVNGFLIEGGDAFALIFILFQEVDTSKLNLIFLSFFFFFFPFLSDAVSFAEDAALALRAGLPVGAQAAQGSSAIGDGAWVKSGMETTKAAGPAA